MGKIIIGLKMKRQCKRNENVSCHDCEKSTNKVQVETKKNVNRQYQIRTIWI